MMKAIMTIRVAGLALAASALTTASALADDETRTERSVSTSTERSVSTSAERSVTTKPLRDRRYVYTNRVNQTRGTSNDQVARPEGVNQFGQTRREVQALESTAIRACRSAITRKGNANGFGIVSFEPAQRAIQTGPEGFTVTLYNVDFQARRGVIERNVRCVVERGTRVETLDGVPAL
ncbi:MAG: hypothetical protein AAF296_06625 [Pseudomonadota bacterium]